MVEREARGTCRCVRYPARVSDSPFDQVRYSRQITLPSFGEEGQRRLRDASIAVIGAGGLGSPALLYLAAAGVGRISLIDGDAVDLSNLHRQVLHSTADVGRRKVDSARARLRELNPDVEVAIVDAMLDESNAQSFIAGHDLVVDGTDNFPTRYLITDAAFFARVPVVYGSVFRFEGQVSVFDPPEGPCYRCLYPSPPPPGLVPDCEEGGVLGVVPGVVGMLQAAEAIKYIAGLGTPLRGRLLLVDLFAGRFREMKIPRNPRCPLCSSSATIHSVAAIAETCETRGSGMSEEITPRELHERIEAGDRPRLIDVREQWEWDQAHLEGAEHIPLGQLQGSADRLDPNEELVVYCRSGARSARAAQWLRGQGFQRVSNLTGGILRWASEIDPSIPRY